MTHRPPSVRARTQLTLHALEPRDCPACTVLQAGSTLHILGDNSANTIVVSDAGESRDQTGFTAPELTVVADGQTTVIPSSPVRRVVIQTLGGDDSVTYKPAAPDGTQSVRFIVLDQGKGDDTADFTVSRPLLDTQDGPISFPDFNLKLNGGSGDDSVAVRFGTLATMSVMVRANLGDGDDTFAAVFAGLVVSSQSTDHSVRFNVQGGAGNDSIDLEAGAFPITQHALTIVVQGGAGDDDLGVNAVLSDQPGSRMIVDLLGGDGDDQVSADLINFSVNQQLADRIDLEGGAGDDDLSLTASSTQASSTAIVNGGLGFDVDSVSTTVPTTIKACELTI